MTFIAGQIADYRHIFQPTWLSILMKQCLLLSMKMKIVSYMNLYVYNDERQSDLFIFWPYLLSQKFIILDYTVTNILFLLHFTHFYTVD